MNIDNSISYGIQLLLQKEDEQTWKKINTLFESLTPVTPEHKHLILKDLNQLIIRSMLSDRSRLSGTALNLILKCKDCEFNFDIFTEPLFKLINRPNKVFSTRAENVLMELVNKLKVKCFYKSYLKSANKNVRHCAYKVAEVVMDDMEVFRIGVTDAHAECRSICKRVLTSKGELVSKKEKGVSVGFFQNINLKAQEVVKKCITQFSPFKKQQKILAERPVPTVKLAFEKKEDVVEEKQEKSRTLDQKNPPQSAPETETMAGCFTPSKIQDYINKYKTKGYLASKYLSEDKKDEEINSNNACNKNNTKVAGEKLEDRQVSLDNCQRPTSLASKNDNTNIENDISGNINAVEKSQIEEKLTNFDENCLEMPVNNIITNTAPEPVFDDPVDTKLKNVQTTIEAANVEMIQEDDTKTCNENTDKCLENTNSTKHIASPEKKSEISAIFDKNNQNDVLGQANSNLQPNETEKQLSSDSLKNVTTFIRDVEHDLSQAVAANTENANSNAFHIDNQNQSGLFDISINNMSQQNMSLLQETTMNTSLSRLSLNENKSVNKGQNNEDNSSDVDRNEYTLVGDSAYIRRDNIEKK